MTEINDYGKRLKELKTKFNDHVHNMIDEIGTENDFNKDLSSYDVTVSFGTTTFKFPLNSVFSETFETVIDEQLSEWGHDLEPMD